MLLLGADEMLLLGAGTIIFIMAMAYLGDDLAYCVTEWKIMSPRVKRWAIARLAIDVMIGGAGLLLIEGGG